MEHAVFQDIFYLYFSILPNSYVQIPIFELYGLSGLNGHNFGGAEDDTQHKFTRIVHVCHTAPKVQLEG